jgi:predicted DNA-binding protein
MATISIRMDDEMKRHLQSVSAAAGMSVSEIVRDAIQNKMEELEDRLVVKSRLGAPFKSVSNEDVWTSLDI